MTRPDLDFERDLALTPEDRQALEASRQYRADPAQLDWRWISLAQQFPNLRQSRETAAGRREFELPKTR